MSFSSSKVLGLAGLAALAGSVGAIACSSDDTTPSATSTASTASAVAGETDTHCGATVVTVDPAACTAKEDDDDHDDAGTAADGGDAGADDGTTSDFGPTRYNSASDDDDCKYHVTWKATPVAENKDLSFVVTAVNKSDGTAVKAANLRAEVYLDETHPAPNSGAKPVESPAGTYTVGPVRFDAPGKWTVRFHFFESCNDNEHSPHGHAAFFVNVP